MAIYEKEDLTNYHILTGLIEDANVSQRMLSTQMGVNVASVNFAIRRLITKGFVKMKGANPRRIKYIVTPKGLTEKSALAYKFFDRNFHFYKDVRSDIEGRIQVASEGKEVKVAICGTNKLSEITVLAIQNMESRLVGVFGGGAERRKKFLGYEVYGLDEMRNKRPNIALLTERDDLDECVKISKESGCVPVDLTGYYRV